MAVQLAAGLKEVAAYPAGWLVRCSCGDEVIVNYGAASAAEGVYRLACKNGHPVEIRVTR